MTKLQMKIKIVAHVFTFLSLGQQGTAQTTTVAPTAGPTVVCSTPQWTDYNRSILASDLLRISGDPAAPAWCAIRHVDNNWLPPGSIVWTVGHFDVTSPNASTCQCQSPYLTPSPTTFDMATYPNGSRVC